MTQGYRSPLLTSRRLDMNWLNFGMPRTRGAQGAQRRAAPGFRHPERPCPDFGGACPGKSDLAEAQATETGTHPPPPTRRASTSTGATFSAGDVPKRAARRRPRQGEGDPVRLGRPTHDAPATRRSAGASSGCRGPGAATSAARGHRTPARERGRADAQSRSRSRRWGRSLRFAERPPWSSRRSMS